MYSVQKLNKSILYFHKFSGILAQFPQWPFNVGQFGHAFFNEALAICGFQHSLATTCVRIQ